MARRTGPSAATVRLVRERDSWSCVRCSATPWSDLPLTTQHRVARGMGGTRAEWINEPANLLTLCGSGTTGCHGWVESHPDEAKRLGLAVTRFADAELVTLLPVFTWRGWLLLDNEGGATRWEDGGRIDGHDTMSRLWG